jgi:hypothetical protein
MTTAANRKRAYYLILMNFVEYEAYWYGLQPPQFWMICGPAPIYWRSLGESNPCFSLERAAS